MAHQAVLKVRKYERGTKPMSTLHWLCICKRIQYKVVSIMFVSKVMLPNTSLTCCQRDKTSGNCNHPQLTPVCQHFTRTLRPASHYLHLPDQGFGSLFLLKSADWMSQRCSRDNSKHTSSLNLMISSIFTYLYT